ncbi:MAG: DUF2934 domain-containing protein [Verrucomicrobiales bacterium]|nr:DUF2934 domain-containing protein [Verrucomicrobiales bacterium]
MNQTAPTHEAIAERAYFLWEQAGQPAGRDDEFWLRAEAELAAPVSADGLPPILPPPTPTPSPIPSASLVQHLPAPLSDAVTTPHPLPSRPRRSKRT